MTLPDAVFSKRTRMYSRRLPPLIAKPAKAMSSGKSNSEAPWHLSKKRLAINIKVTKPDTGLPGKPNNGVCPTRPNARGLPGLIASRQSSKAPSFSIAAFTWSSSPTETPPLLKIQSACNSPCFSAASVASGVSATRPKSTGSKPKCLSTVWIA